MKHKIFILFITILLSTSLACTLFVGGPDYSELTPIPISGDEAQTLTNNVQKAFEESLQTGIVTITMTEAQITSLVALKLTTDPNLQQEDGTPIITEPQVHLRDGQMKIYGKTQQGVFTANIGIILSVTVDENGEPKIEIISADFGPFPAPEGINDTITAVVDEAYTGALGPVATGLRIETITIADGLMTITGRTR